MQEPSYSELKIICLDLNRRLRFLEDQVQELQRQLTQQRIDIASRLPELSRIVSSSDDMATTIDAHPIRYSKEVILACRPRRGSEASDNNNGDVMNPTHLQATCEENALEPSSEL